LYVGGGGSSGSGGGGGGSTNVNPGTPSQIIAGGGGGGGGNCAGGDGGGFGFSGGIGSCSAGASGGGGGAGGSGGYGGGYGNGGAGGNGNGGVGGVGNGGGGGGASGASSGGGGGGGGFGGGGGAFIGLGFGGGGGGGSTGGTITIGSNRGAATNPGGNGSIVITWADAPTAVTGAASGITATGATLAGTVNDNGANTTVSFDYGTTTAYGANVAATTGGTISSGSGSTPVAVTLGNLSCNTAYHFRVNGVNISGTTNGSDASFTTAACALAPTVAGIFPTSGTTLGGTSVTISGTNFTGASGVTIGGAGCTSLSVVSATSITCVTPSHSAVTASVLVTTAGGTNAANALFTYTVRQTPAIATSLGGGTVTAQIVSGSAGCSIDLNNTTAFTPPAYNGTTPAYGGLKLRLTGCTLGETVQVSTTWPNMTGLTLQKYGPTPTSNGSSVYYTPTGVSVVGNTVTYSITDNGLGDDTFTGADGVINDPAVPVPLGSGPASIPTLSEWGMIILASLMALFGLWQVRRRGFAKRFSPFEWRLTRFWVGCMAKLDRQLE
jgi:hypothetical protein